jgi:hypothetical protein
MSDDAWIAEYIEPNPHSPDIDEARLKGYGVAVWALIATLPGCVIISWVLWLRS